MRYYAQVEWVAILPLELIQGPLPVRLCAWIVCVRGRVCAVVCMCVCVCVCGGIEYVRKTIKTCSPVVSPFSSYVKILLLFPTCLPSNTAASR